MAIEILMLQAGDDAVLKDVVPGVFDNPLDPRLTAEFLGDPRHHLTVAVDDGQVVGFASGIRYVHPDKAAELWVNEVGVAPTHQRRGLGTAVLRKLLERGRELGCQQAWLLTNQANTAGMRLFASLGGGEVPTPAILFEFALTAPVTRGQ